ncbi:MAG: 4Fe-4S dicluster domain-containing protein [Nitrososphaeria archaeon]
MGFSDYFINSTKNKIGVLKHGCEHNPSGEVKICDSAELADFIKRLNINGLIIVGVYDETHLKLYKEAALKAGLNPLLLRVVDYRWGDEAIAQNTVMLERNFVADKAQVIDITLPLSRREVITGAVKVGKDRVDKPVYISDYCGYLYRECTVCQDSCPYNAITVDKKSGVKIDYEKCTACGLCVASCPESALQFPSAPQRSIFDLSALKGNKTISCYKDKGNSIKLPCIAMLSLEDLLALRSSGEVYLRCVGCELEKNLEKLKQNVMAVNSVIGGIKFEIRGNTEKSVEPVPFTIRLDNVEKRSDLRKRFKENKLKDILSYDVKVDDSCTLCEACAKWCPVSALKIENIDGQKALTFDPDPCIGCNICINVCPESSKDGSGKAIKVYRGKSEKKVLARDYLVKCRVCGAPVGSRRSLNRIKEVMRKQGMEVDDEWLELCPKHRSEYAVKKFLGPNSQFKPRGSVKDD